MRVQISFWILISLLIIAVVGGLITGDVVFSRLIFLLVLMLVVNLLWSAASAHGYDIERNARFLRQQVGHVFEERYRVKNRSPFLRLWVEIKDLSDLPGNSGSRVLSWIGGKQERSYLSRTLLVHRGAFRLGPTRIKSGDPFGIFTFTQTVISEKTLLVLPYFVVLEEFPSPAGILPGGRALQRRSLEVTPYAAGVREYTPGDPLSRIHWRSTARRGHMMVKEFEQDPQANVWLLLDAFKDVHFMEREAVKIDNERVWMWTNQTEIHLTPSTFEYCVSALASAAEFYIREGKAVGFACSAQSQVILPPERGERQFGKILETLALLAPTGGLPLQGLVEMVAGLIPRGSSVVLSTASTRDDIELTVDVLTRRNLRPVVILVNPQSFGAPWNPRFLLTNIRGRNIPTTLISKDDDLKQSLEAGFFDEAQ